LTDVPFLRVAAGLISRDGRWLLTRRPAGTHLEGHWEFPGGKIEPGEGPREALVRELREELGIEAGAASEAFVLRYRYPDREVELHFLHARILSGEPRPLDVAGLGWYTPDEIDELPLLPADREAVRRLRALAGGGEEAR